MPKFSSEFEHGIGTKLSEERSRLALFYRRSQHHIYYSRKVGYFLQVLDFEPSVLDGRGRRRPPSEFKLLAFHSEAQAKIALCALNSNLFYWFVTVFSDCRHVNKREVDAFPIDLPRIETSQEGPEFVMLARDLMAQLKANSVERVMSFSHDRLTVQCIFPKQSKPLIDRIDSLLARHYGFTDEELDFILNYDIKYRMGQDAGEPEDE